MNGVADVDEVWRFLCNHACAVRAHILLMWLLPFSSRFWRKRKMKTSLWAWLGQTPSENRLPILSSCPLSSHCGSHCLMSGERWQHTHTHTLRTLTRWLRRFAVSDKVVTIKNDRASGVRWNKQFWTNLLWAGIWNGATSWCFWVGVLLGSRAAESSATASLLFYFTLFQAQVKRKLLSTLAF